MARDNEMRPIKVADMVIVGFMWPPETGWVARRRSATMIATKQASKMFGVSLWILEDMKMLSNINTKIAVLKSSATDALHT